MLVYLELSERKHWFDVEIRPCESLKRVFITGKPRKKAKKEVILPVSVDTAFSIEELRKIVQDISSCCHDIVADNPGITLGICEADSTIVYYKVFDGLIQPGHLNLENELENDEG